MHENSNQKSCFNEFLVHLGGLYLFDIIFDSIRNIPKSRKR